MSKVSTHVKFLPWTKHYDSEVPLTLSYPQEPLPSLFHKSVKNYAEAIALIFFGRKISYRQLGSYVK